MTVLSGVVVRGHVCGSVVVGRLGTFLSGFIGDAVIAGVGFSFFKRS